MLTSSHRAKFDGTLTLETYVMPRRRLLSTCAMVAVLAFPACNAKDAPVSDEASVDGATSSDTPQQEGELGARDIAMYPLDMRKMRNWVGASKAIVAAYEKDAAAAALAEQRKREDIESPAQQIERLESEPVVMEVLRLRGMSARDYVMTIGSYLQATKAGGALAVNPKAKVPDGQSPENIEFVQSNKTELERMFKEAGMSR